MYCSLCRFHIVLNIQYLHSANQRQDAEDRLQCNLNAENNGIDVIAKTQTKCN